MCDRLEFQTPAEFQGWRSSQKFRAFSLDKDEAERACIAMYVNALIQISHNLVAWPVIITKSESPDFKLRFGNNPEIGVEHSTITSTKYQQFRAESLRDPEDSVVFLDSFKLGGPPENNHNAGWVGKEAEREWSTLALLRTKAKLDKLNRSHFLKNARNELLLNTVSYLPNLDIQTAIRMFADQLSQEIETRKRQHLFDAISIIYGSTTIPQALVKQIR
ncbi:MAG: hypothetical protein Q8P51_00685 [Ignavibacteria bacterium]|nr:hypothetical protein [Ignavibacteria bacterium]